MGDAEFMRNAWIGTFTEMQKHMNPEEVRSVKSYGNKFGFHEEEDETEIDASEQRSQRYRCVLPCGQVRNNCSYNAA